MTVEPDLRVVADLGDQRGHSIAHLLEDQRTGRVDDVHALAAGVDHDPCLFRQPLRRLRVRHHQEPDGLQIQVASQSEVLDRDVGLGAVRRDPDHGDPEVGDGADVVLGAEAGQHERGDLRLLGLVDGGGDQRPLVLEGESVVERRSAEAVAVGDLDDRHAGTVESGDDAAHHLLVELVTLGVRSVTQRRVGDADVELVRVRHQVLDLHHVTSDLLTDLRRGGRHDVEVAGVRRKVVAGPLDLDEDRNPCRPGRMSAGSNCGR